MLAIKHSPVAIDFHSVEKNTVEVNDYRQLFGWQHSSKYHFCIQIQIWNNMSKWWQNFNFWWTISLNTEIKVYVEVLKWLNWEYKLKLNWNIKNIKNVYYKITTKIKKKTEHKNRNRKR